MAVYGSLRGAFLGSDVIFAQRGLSHGHRIYRARPHTVYYSKSAISAKRRRRMRTFWKYTIAAHFVFFLYLIANTESVDGTTPSAVSQTARNRYIDRLCASPCRLSRAHASSERILIHADGQRVHAGCQRVHAGCQRVHAGCQRVHVSVRCRAAQAFNWILEGDLHKNALHCTSL